MRNTFYKTLLSLLTAGGLAPTLLAQCPQITCPSNVTVNAATGSCAANVTYSTPVGTNPCGGTTTATFNYTGTMQTFTVPSGVTSITVDAQGAQGGANGGLGGRAIATIPVTSGEVLQVWVGGRPASEIGPGGFNGGGAVVIEPCGSGASYSWPGGGASDIRRGSGLNNRLIVAGGGGGQGWSTGLGGAGGGTTGTDGAASWIAGTNGKGGSQVAGGLGGFYSGNSQSSPNGTLGVGGDGSPLNTYCTGGGGGGGYYGGGGGYVSAGGGGSSYVAYPGNTSTSTTAGFRTGHGIITITYNGGGSATTTQTVGLASGASFPVGTTSNTFRVTDGLGNSSTCAFSVTVVDAQAPSVTCPTNMNATTAPGQCTAVVSFTTPTGTDNCSGVSTTQTAGLSSGSSFPTGVNSVTFRATDAAGLTGTCSFSVTVVDGQAPTVTCPANISANTSLGQCTAAVTFSTPSGTDNCAGVSTTQTAGLPSGSNFPMGASSVTFRATDAAGLTGTCSFTVTVVDGQAPSVTCPANITANTSPGLCSAVVSFSTPTGTDNCSSVTTAQSSGLPSGSTFPLGVSNVAFQATDAGGLTSTCSFSVTVVDAQAPILTCPPNANPSTSPGQCTAVVNFTAPVGTDNCSGVSTVQSSGLASGSSFPIGISTVSYTATDGVGLTAACSFTITVVDNEAPTINCPPNVSNTNDAGLCTAMVNFNAATAGDNCSGVSTSLTTGMPSGSAFPIGVTTQTYTATDASGNTTTCVFTVSVADSEAPTILCPTGFTVTPNGPNCSATVTYIAPTGTDNCTGASTVLVAGLPSGSSFPQGGTVNTFEVTDASGNSASCSFTITVNGTTTQTNSVNLCQGQSVTVGNHTYSQQGTYTDTLVGPNGCDLVMTTIVTVNTINTATSVSGNTLMALAAGATYQWVDCDNGMAPIPGETNQSFTASVTGNYAVIIMDNNGCIDTSACTNVVVVGIDNGFAKGMLLHPNPSDGRVTLDFGKQLQDVELRVMDLQGRILLRQSNLSGIKADLDVRFLSPAVYLLEVVGQEGRHSFKMVIQ